MFEKNTLAFWVIDAGKNFYNTDTYIHLSWGLYHITYYGRNLWFP